MSNVCNGNCEICNIDVCPNFRETVAESPENPPENTVNAN